MPKVMQERNISEGEAESCFFDTEDNFKIGSVHIKWFAICKHLLLLAYLIYSIKEEVVDSQVQQCQFQNNDGIQELPCIRSTCIWITRISGLLPSHLIKSHSHICSFMQAIAFFASLAVIITIYCRHRRLSSAVKWEFRRYLVLLFAVIPSSVTELFIVFFWYYALVMSVTWKVHPEPNHLASLRTFVLCILLAIIAFFEVTLHFMSMMYLMSIRNNETLQFYMGSYQAPTDNFLDQDHSMHKRYPVIPRQKIPKRHGHRSTSNDGTSASRHSIADMLRPTPPCSRNMHHMHFRPKLNGGSFPRNFRPSFNDRACIRKPELDVTKTSTYDRISYNDMNDDYHSIPRPPPRRFPTAKSPGDTDSMYEYA